MRCEPVRAEDEPIADQATAYLNHIFYKENDGFTLLYNFFKDALIEKNGMKEISASRTGQRITLLLIHLTLSEQDVLFSEEKLATGKRKLM